MTRLSHKINPMSTLKELRLLAKEAGLRGYSTMTKSELEQSRRGEKVVRYKQRQAHHATQTEFSQCSDCALQTQMDMMCWQAERPKRKTVVVDGVEIDIETGEVLGAEIEHERDVHMNAQKTKKKRW